MAQSKGYRETKGVSSLVGTDQESTCLGTRERQKFV